MTAVERVAFRRCPYHYRLDDIEAAQELQPPPQWGAESSDHAVAGWEDMSMIFLRIDMSYIRVDRIEIFLWRHEKQHASISAPFATDPLQRLRALTQNIQVRLIREHPVTALPGEFVDDFHVAERGDGGADGGRTQGQVRPDLRDA